jgi:hypothetical protein
MDNQADVDFFCDETDSEKCVHCQNPVCRMGETITLDDETEEQKRWREREERLTKKRSQQTC